MILYEILGDEQHQAYEDLSIDNLERQYDFLRSIINAANTLQRPMVSTAIIQALNAHAISCLHVNAGQYRPCDVAVGDYMPPAHYRVPELMNEFVNHVNLIWNECDPLVLATYVLWRLNNIHPFINGNGRTARALCYYVVCVKVGGLLPGPVTLPELIRQNRSEYVELLRATDNRISDRVSLFEALAPLHGLIARLMEAQLEADDPAI